MKLLAGSYCNSDYEYVGGNVFYGVYYLPENGFYLAWDMAFGKGKFDFVNFPTADFDKSLDGILKKLTKQSKECWRECRGLGITTSSPLLNFKFHWGKNKKYVRFNR